MKLSVEFWSQYERLKNVERLLLHSFLQEFVRSQLNDKMVKVLMTCKLSGECFNGDTKKQA